MRTSTLVPAVLAASAASWFVFSPTALAGPDWTEVGDAGSFLGNAQIPTGIGPITNINGGLGGSTTLTLDYEDMYLISVVDPSLFSMQVANANFNAQLFIFNITLPGGAYGLLGNNDRSVSDDRPLVFNTSTDGPSPVTIDLPGDYLVAVCGLGRNPLSDTGLIFNFATSTEVSRADGPGGLNRHTAWTGEGEVGTYNIEFTGAAFPGVPSPATLGLLVLAGMPRRRR